jgi:uncharacterized protein YbbK (DUF523 family)
MIMVSSCLAGLCSKYNGGDNLNKDIERLVREGRAIVVCPEQMGGCPTPRNPCEIASNKTGQDVLDGNAKVIDSKGQECTEKFLWGAVETLKLAKLFNIEFAVLKANSPSCGCGKVYDGSFGGRLINGNGVAAQMLINNGYKVFTEEDYSNTIGRQKW